MADYYKYFLNHGYNKNEIVKCFNNLIENYNLHEIMAVLKSEIGLNKIVEHLGNTDLIPKIREIYNRGYEFPIWTSEAIQNNLNLKPLVTVYYDEKDDVSTIRRLCIQREPVNISQRRYYNKDKLGEIFGWKEGFYQYIWDISEKPKKLGPNFAIYCKTPVRMNNVSYPDAHIINSIGAALDSVIGPDYKYFIKDRRSVDMIKELKLFYRKVFSYIFKCAVEKNLSNVCMSLVGANNFAANFPGGVGKFQNTVWIPTFSDIRKLYPDTSVVFMGVNEDFLHRLKTNSNESYENVGYFPQLLNNIDANNTLIVNAWDPFSFVGNGNNYDNSLDGFIGRATACSMLCWPKVNSQMKYIPLKIES